MPQKYTEELKRQAVIHFENTSSVDATCLKYSIARSTLYRWIKDYSNIGTEQESFTLADFETLKRKLTRANHLLQIIRLSNIIEQVDLQTKLTILTKIYEQNEEFSVREICEALNVARGTFYNHIFRKVDRTRFLEEQRMLALQIQQIFDDSDQRYGAQKIAAVLSENGIKVGKRRVKTLMNELGLKSIREGAKSSYQKHQERLKKNLLARNFTASRINEKWVSDITYFKVKNYSLFLCVIIDLFSRKVVGYKVSHKSSTNLVTSTFRQAFQSRGCPENLTFHSDRGCQYTSETFRTLLKSCSVNQSFSHTGRPIDNAVAETFFATFKREEAYRRFYNSEKDFKKAVDDYMRFYNEERPHQTLAYKSPNRFEELYGRKNDK